MVLDFVLETLATITGVVSSFAMLPQIYRIFKKKGKVLSNQPNKSAKNTLCTIAYALIQKDFRQKDYQFNV
jgi:uncharacterized protein with PQ loop repeat